MSYTTDELKAGLEAGRAGGLSLRAIAKTFGYADWPPMRERLKRAGVPVPGVVSRGEVPSVAPNAQEIITRRKAEFQRKEAHERARRCVDIHIDDSVGVIGILVNGDEHLDNPGTRIDLVERYATLVAETDGLFAVSMGDVHDAWIGRLQRLYASAGTTLEEALTLCEWYIDTLGEKLLFAVGGNHNAGWWGENDPLIAMMRKNGTLYLDSEVRVALHIDEAPPITITARHGWPGRSQWNAGHGVQKAAQMGCTDDLLLGGHTHVSAYGLVKQPGAGITHCLQVASYKVHDQYQRDLGLRDQNIAPAALVLVDPRASEVGRVTVFHDIERGVEVLNLLRANYSLNK